MLLQIAKASHHMFHDHQALLKKLPVGDPVTRCTDPSTTSELYVEELAEKRFVSIRMGWLWVEGTTMRLALRALNLCQAEPSICQPHALALGFTLSNSQGDTLATFWADTEPIWWSWVRAIAAELVRQTPFRAQRCLNFLGILTTCPRGPVPLPDTPPDQRRRSRSELRCWPGAELTISDKLSPDQVDSGCIMDENRRRARSELRGWSSSNSSDEDLVMSGVVGNGTHQVVGHATRAWGCSESSEGSDDSLPWGAGPCRSSVDSVDSAICMQPEPSTREQRMQKYKEARRRENEARRKQVLEEDARRRKANKAAVAAAAMSVTSSDHTMEENNNDVQIHRSSRSRLFVSDISPKLESPVSRLTRLDNVPSVRSQSAFGKNTIDTTNTVRFDTTRYHSCDDNRNNNNNNARNNQINSTLSNGSTKPGILRTDTNERRSRARERRCIRERSALLNLSNIGMDNDYYNSVESLKERKERLNAGLTAIRFPEIGMDCTDRTPRSVLMTTSLSIMRNSPCEEEVAKLLERCQRVDHYVPVREKLTLFESLSRMGGRLARSTEDLGRSSSNPSPQGKQRARSLHDLNRGGLKSVPVREMCRFFENGQPESPISIKKDWTRTKFGDFSLVNGHSRNIMNCKDPPKNPDAPCLRTSNRKKHFAR
ncbi:hypothetical protein QAD02_022420 [Eretmocerus hayati]|uniref:Uncharacterized protein n=1 Tax=Eretmocerus hayati TaxID=131215 RepID=A0ACC2PUJ8_9HYME|nr:hypothetical protein QAD02_022420 [Eretmocerus hayati]